jgi:hypothetical protein
MPTTALPRSMYSAGAGAVDAPGAGIYIGVVPFVF